VSSYLAARMQEEREVLLSFRPALLTKRAGVLWLGASSSGRVRIANAHTVYRLPAALRNRPYSPSLGVPEWQLRPALPFEEGLAARKRRHSQAIASSVVSFWS